MTVLECPQRLGLIVSSASIFLLAGAFYVRNSTVHINGDTTFDHSRSHKDGGEQERKRLL